MTHGRAYAQPTASTYIHSARQVRARTDVHRMRQRTVVVHSSTGVNNASSANHCVHIHHGTGHHHRARAQPGKRTHTGAGMHNRGKAGASGLQGLLLLPAHSAVANSDKHPIKFSHPRQQGGCAAQYRPMSVAGHARPSIVKKYHNLPTRRQCGIGNHLAVAAGTQQG